MNPVLCFLKNMVSHSVLATNNTGYINRKGRYSVIISIFIDVAIIWLGCVYDARVFPNSSINTKLRNGSITKCEKVIAHNEPLVPVCMLGDSAYPLLPFLMKEFANCGKNLSEQFYGLRLLSARMVFECSLARLKARLGCLRRVIDINLNDLTR